MTSNRENSERDPVESPMGGGGMGQSTINMRKFANFTHIWGNQSLYTTTNRVLSNMVFSAHE